MGVLEVTREAYPDPTQFQQTSTFYDPESSVGNPRWVSVEVRAMHARPAGARALNLKPGGEFITKALGPAGAFK